MNITKAQYYKDMSGNNVVGIKVTLDDNLSWVPLDENNADYIAILEWAKENGNEIAAAD
tara:strand:+ start:949 stop:1125 length:177 start_codon:yes stop_codon:yes gene_type:complete